MTAPLPPAVGKSHLQTAHLVELLLQGDHDRVRDLILAMPADEIMPLLGGALIFGAEAMRDNLGTAGALEQIGKVRREVGIRGGGLHE